MFDFGAFQNKMHMPSRETYIFHVLFGTFHITSRIITDTSSLELKQQVCAAKSLDLGVRLWIYTILEN